VTRVTQPYKSHRSLSHLPRTTSGDLADSSHPSQVSLLTTSQVADYLGLSPATVLRRWRAGELPGYRLGSNVLRFRADELATWLEQRRG